MNIWPLRPIDGVWTRIFAIGIPVACLIIYSGLSMADPARDDAPTTRRPSHAAAPATSPPRRITALVAPVGPAESAAQTRLAEQAFDCVVEPFQVVKLASPVVGVIGRLDVERGDSVRKGQVLGKLDDSVEQANLVLARAKARDEYSAGAIREHLVFLRLRQSRAEALAEKKFVTTAIRDEATADTKVAEQQLEQAQLNKHMAALDVTHAEKILDQKLLRSPIDGVVTEILLRPGEYRNEQTPIMSLAQIDPLRVEVFVPTRYYGQIDRIHSASVMPESPVGGAHPARVTVIDRVIDAASGTFGVRLEMPNPKHVVPAGLQCKVRFAA